MNNNKDLLKELEAFYERLRDYKTLLTDKSHLGLSKRSFQYMIEEERNTLVRKCGQLKEVIIELTGKQYMALFGNEYDIWAEGLSPYLNSQRHKPALDFCIDATNEAIGKLRSMPIADTKSLDIQDIGLLQPPKAFIAHGGDSPALRKLKNFLEALGVQPLVVEEQPSEGRSVGENVDWYARQADCAIVLATKGDVDSKTGGFIPRGNVLMEIGKLQELFKDRIIYLLQAGTKFPTNISEKVRERFTTQNMDNAFIKIAKELKKFGILKAVKPQTEGKF